MQTIDLSIDYKSKQVLNTNAEIKRMLEYAEHIPFEDMQARLIEIGLKLDTNVNSYALYYYNTSNKNHYFQMTTSPIDNKKLSAYNVGSEFYNRYLKGMHTSNGIELDKLRNNYFTTIVKSGKTYIVSF
jgi:oligoribonuclease NrnB/cAMP/cGMP phosphodiesterase (DHH superfamily)